MGSKRIRGGKSESRKMDGGETSSFREWDSEGNQVEGVDRREPSTSRYGCIEGGHVEVVGKATGLTTASQETGEESSTT